jgi:hypothetical protein
VDVVKLHQMINALNARVIDVVRQNLVAAVTLLLAAALSARLFY